MFATVEGMAPEPNRNRRERPAKPALSRQAIVATAVDLMGAEGLRRVTMRRLAEALDTAPASLYVYVRNTAELHAAVLDHLLGSVDLTPVQADGDWRDRLVEVLTSYTAGAVRASGARRLRAGRPPVRAPLPGPGRSAARAAGRGRCPGRSGGVGIDLLSYTTTATAGEHAGGDSEEDWLALAAAVRDASPDTHPHVVALGADLLSGPPEARLTWGLHMLINGIAHTARLDTP